MKIASIVISAIALYGTSVLADDTNSDAEAEYQTPESIKVGYYMVRGKFELPDGGSYIMSVPLDLFKPKFEENIERRAVLIPETYKSAGGFGSGNGNLKGFVKSVDGLDPPHFQLSCDGLMGKGTKGWVGRNPISLDCSWQNVSGYRGVEGSFNAFFTRSTSEEVQAIKDRYPTDAIKDIKGDFNTLKLDMSFFTGDNIVLHLPMDELSYQAGSSHSAYIYPRQVVKKLNTQLKDAGIKSRFKGCSDANSGDLRGIVGRSPKLSCTLFDKNVGNKSNVDAYQLVTLEQKINTE